MKRVCVLLLLLASGLLLPLAASHAANLQAGWYANALGIDFCQMVDPYTEMAIACGRFTTPTGDYGPFRVGAPDTRARTVAVPNAAYGVTPSQSLTLLTEVQLIDAYDLTQVSRTSVHWSTNYDSSQMVLELWSRTSQHEQFRRMWYQPLSNQRQGVANLAGGDMRDASFFFRVAVIPEPASAACLSSFLGVVIVLLRRRRSN